VNLVGADTREEQQAVVHVLSDMTWYVDKSLFEDPIYGAFDFQGGRVLVVGSDDIARDSKIAYSGITKTRFLKVSNHLYTPITENVEQLTRTLTSVPFVPNDVGLLPLVTNGATLEALLEVPEANRASLIESTREELFHTIDKWSGKTLFVMGHVEDASFVMKDAGDNVLLTATLNELKAYGREHKVNIVTIGCNSAVHTGTGAANVFNTLDAVSQFRVAISSDSWAKFLSAFAGQNLDLVVDHSLIDEAGKLHINIKVHPSKSLYLFPLGTMSGTLLPNDSTGYPWYVWVGGIFAFLFLCSRAAKRI